MKGEAEGINNFKFLIELSITQFTGFGGKFSRIERTLAEGVPVLCALRVQGTQLLKVLRSAREGKHDENSPYECPDKEDHQQRH